MFNPAPRCNSGTAVCHDQQQRRQRHVAVPRTRVAMRTDESVTVAASHVRVADLVITSSFGEQQAVGS